MTEHSARTSTTGSHSRPGVIAGKAAGMSVIAVPSLPNQSELSTSADEVINSLLDLQPEKWGLPPFLDWIEGPVIKGFGRGSKVLGIPTGGCSILDWLVGWARLSTRGVYKMEPWLLHDFSEDFYGEELHLAIVGYIRPEGNFPSLESLISKIYEDRKIAENALDLPLYVRHKDAPYLTGSLQPKEHD
ncbi:hypothetical protein AQUCO_02000104v1 [Aquilegia coerulea]|uniref:riboflavin kinase n=1 Tax=Aquilegia coerulea TaxID=218851 RepID=A0A2G5DFX0_AQUCA|nr:hypothetical protein AQUCO_02000104v1 [Aquilegia coerulea]